MAEFFPAFEQVILNEGGYKLTNVPGDRGGQTYAGIARSRWPNWLGWRDIDAGQIPDTALVRDFYRRNFWDAVRGSDIESQEVACSLFDFAVNAGPAIAIKLAQIVVLTTPDGAIGPKTLAAINAIEDYRAFKIAYTLAKVARYRDICMKDRSQSKFLLGWINRTLEQLE